MRTTLSNIRLFNDDRQNMTHPFYSQQKGFRALARQTEREKEKRVRGRVWVKKGCSMGNKLDIWSSYLRGYRDEIYLDEH